MKKLCIYHGNCTDGFGAAWVVRKKYGDDVEFHAGTYQAPPPDVTGRDVIMVDFSYKKPVLEEMLTKAEGIYVIDHHKTALEDLSSIHHEKFACVFDMHSSGAGLAWHTFFSGQEPPALIKHIEDRDLWKFELEGTREIQAAVFSFPYDFEVWDKLMAMDAQDLRKDGIAIERKHFKDIEELLAITTRRMNIGGFNIPVANLPYIFSSDAGHKLATGEAFGACYWDTPEGRIFSLRSTDAGQDVSAVAKQFGGGGHRNASGFKVSYDEAKAFEVAA